ncbi:ASPIC/UnbV domain-containing protein [Mucilaginibacter lutimaris]|uniref:ASPIC/UnbV domain-containing protein n=1 Tax=Mucilaginibacter lutimaris TaxID=931629 RepID=A0ABW2ZIP2_9SPHI
MNVAFISAILEMGGAYIGDSYTSSLYLNPGQSSNSWISIKLAGVKSNKAAIGSHIKLSITENGVKRSIYKDVNSGGSFGASPLTQEIGIGRAKIIDEMEIKWAGSGTIQTFKNVAPGQFLHLSEGGDLVAKKLDKLTLKNKKVWQFVCL